MKLNVLKENLSLALSAVNKSTPVRTSLPILKNVLLKTEGSKLFLSTTDLEMSVNAGVSAEIEEQGATTVLASTFFEYINSLPNGVIHIALNGNQLEVSTVSNKAKFATIPAEEFPSIIKPEKDPFLTIHSEIFVESLDKVIFAASTDNLRPLLTGILFEITEDNLNLVGVDGFRLSKKSFQVQSTQNINLIVPAKSLQEIARIIAENSKESKEDIKIYLQSNKNNLIFSYKGIDFATRLIEGEFPDYKRIIPNDFTTTCDTKKDDFASSLKIVNVFTKSASSSRIEINFTTEQVVRLSSSLSHVGENVTEVASQIEGEGGVVNFNNKYITDILNHMKSDSIVIKSSPGKTLPTVFLEKGEEEIDSSFLHLIMPMSVK